jgi:hypothetical protein
LVDTAVTHTLGYRGAAGAGIDVEAGAFVTLQGSRVQASRSAGITVFGMGTVVRVADSAVLDTVAGADGRFGNGVVVSYGGFASIERSWVAGNAEASIGSMGDGTTASLDDVIVSDTAPSMRGYGLGVAAIAQGSIQGSRIAVVGSAGAALAAVPVAAGMGLVTADSTINVSDVFVRGVHTSTVQFDEAGNGTGPSVAYGAHAGLQCAVTVQRALIDQGGYGFFASSARFTLRQAVISNQLDAEGAVNGASAQFPYVAEQLTSINDARDIQQNAMLPAAGSVAPPSPVCPPMGCM